MFVHERCVPYASFIHAGLPPMPTIRSVQSITHPVCETVQTLATKSYNAHASLVLSWGCQELEGHWWWFLDLHMTHQSKLMSKWNIVHGLGWKMRQTLVDMFWLLAQSTHVSVSVENHSVSYRTGNYILCMYSISYCASPLPQQGQQLLAVSSWIFLLWCCR